MAHELRIGVGQRVGANNFIELFLESVSETHLHVGTNSLRVELIYLLGVGRGLIRDVGAILVPAVSAFLIEQLAPKTWFLALPENSALCNYLPFRRDSASL